MVHQKNATCFEEDPTFSDNKRECCISSVVHLQSLFDEFASPSMEQAFFETTKSSGSQASLPAPSPLDSSGVVLLDEAQLLHMGKTTSRTGSASGLDSPVAYVDLAGDLQKSSRVLGLGLVLPIYYFLSCGGPTGIEPVVSSGGPLLGLLSVIIYPVIFSAPLCLIVAELCTAFPDDGGYVIWVKNAFGPFWGFLEGYWAWVSNVLCNAASAGLVLDGLTSVYGELASPIVKYLVKLAIVVLLSLPTLFGVKVVGKTSVLFLLLVLFPAILLTFWCFAEAHQYELLSISKEFKAASPDDQVDWKTLLTTVFWSYDGLYFVSLFGGQIAKPAYTYPRAIFLNLAAIVVTYALPVIAIVAVARVEWRDFVDGTMTTLAELLGGSFLHGLELLAVICSNAGLFMTTNFATVYQINGMAENDLAPRVFSRRHYFFETPHFALLLNVVPICLVMAFDLNVLQQTANCFSAAVQVMIILAALKLRIDHGDIYRPTQIPGGFPMVLLLMIVPFVVLGFVIITAFASVIAALVSAAFVFVGVMYGFYTFEIAH